MPNLCSYHIKHIIRKRKSIDVIAHVYEGEINTQDEMGPNGDIVPITRYRPTAKIATVDITFDKPFSESAIHAHLKNYLKEVPGKTPIEAQT